MDQQTQKAVQTTLQMLTSDEVNTPNSMNADLATMQNILVAVLQGQWVLQQKRQDDPPPPPPPPGDDGEGAKH